MPWKLLAFILVVAVVLVFAGFNLDNRCDISVVFYTFTGVSVVLTMLGAFLLGLLAAFFLAVGSGMRTKARIAKNEAAKNDAASKAEATAREAAPIQPDAAALGQEAAVKRKRGK